MNFLDVNDIASVCRIIEDNASLHEKNIMSLRECDPNDQLIYKTISTTDGEKKITIDKMPIKMSQNPSANIEAHLLSAV
jgi:hypothetical protein